MLNRMERFLHYTSYKAKLLNNKMQIQSIIADIPVQQEIALCFFRKCLIYWPQRQKFAASNGSDNQYLKEPAAGCQEDQPEADRWK